MKQRIFMILAGSVILIIGVAYMVMPRGPEWTTKSLEALAELDAAWDAAQKLYGQEARGHLEKALALDPDFVIAKLRLAELERHENSERATKLLAEVRQADLKKLKPREAFLVERALLVEDGKWKEAAEALDAFFAEHPDDPQILYVKAMDDWMNGRLAPSEKLFSRLLEIRPNWVIAYNQLGYISMIQGRFSKAEEYFTSYRFIAPDQANPHDSLGELYVLIGRWEEAEVSFRKALEVKPEFGASMGHMAALDALRGRWGDAGKWIDLAESTGAYRADYAHSFRCNLEFWQLVAHQDWESVLREAAGDCDPRKSPVARSAVLFHEAACRLGRWDPAEAIETELRSRVENMPASNSAWFDVRQSMLDHLRGIRLSAQGEPGEAVRALEKADQGLVYLNMEVGLFKLSNRLALVGVLQSEGKETESRSWLEKVRKVNPAFTESWEQGPPRVWEGEPVSR